MAVWSQSYLKRETTDIESGELASCVGIKFPNNRACSCAGHSKGLSAKEGSKATLPPLARARGKGWGVLGNSTSGRRLLLAHLKTAN